MPYIEIIDHQAASGKIAGFFFVAAKFVSLLSLVGSLCVVAWQVLHWLDFGQWKPLSGLDALVYLHWHYPTVQGVGLKEVIAIALGFSLALWVLTLGLLIACLLAFIARRLDALIRPDARQQGS